VPVCFSDQGLTFNRTYQIPFKIQKEGICRLSYPVVNAAFNWITSVQVKLDF